jgi:hypothetical protein
LLILLPHSAALLCAALRRWLGCGYGQNFENMFCAALPQWMYLHSVWHLTAGLGTYLMIWCQLSYHLSRHGLTHFLHVHATLCLPYISFSPVNARMSSVAKQAAA